MGEVIKLPSEPFSKWLEYLVKDVINLAEAGGNTAAFASLNLILAEAYTYIKGEDGIAVSPQIVLDWAKTQIRVTAIPKYNYELTEDLTILIKSMSSHLITAIKSGASYGFIIAIEVALARAYLVVEGQDPLSNSNRRGDLIKWAWLIVYHDEHKLKLDEIKPWLI